MPVSSRRCGMITKREAERLCKSFLAETEPPKLPESFSFDVYHSCAWGCRGSFTPSRYNSSRLVGYFLFFFVWLGHQRRADNLIWNKNNNPVSLIGWNRAKCIKCSYCALFFSPNKFIFHSHRLPTSKYVQPDAANFNRYVCFFHWIQSHSIQFQFQFITTTSWRRHIKLVGNPEPSDHIIYAWEGNYH